MTQFHPSFDAESGTGPTSGLPPGAMDIAFWVDAAMLAGEGAFVRHLVMGLKAEGQRITFIAPHGLSLAALPVLGSRVLTYKWNRWEKLPVLQKLRLNGVAQALNDAPPDLLVAWGCSDATALGVMAQVAPSLPVVVWCWDAAELFTPLTRVATVRHIVASSTAIAARRPEGRGAAGRAGGTSAGMAGVPMTVVHPGVYSEETVACFDVEGQVACLVSLDPLSHRGAYEALLRACRMIADRGQDFQLFAYDQGTAEYPIWRFAEELNVLDRVSFVPFQQDAEPLLLHGDLYIHIVPAARVHYRSLEAMSRGLAVVTCPNHGADYLVDGETCRIVGPQTPEAWRDVLTGMMVNRVQTAAIARRGQQHIREHHSMARTLEQFGSICRQATGMAIPLSGR